jgi:predicted DNA-binding transcriptional regulator AlpA
MKSDNRHPEIVNASAGTSAGSRARALDPPVRRRTAHDDLALIRKSELARHLGITTYTLDRWTRAGTFPRPIFTSDQAPARWRVRDVEAWLAKRQNSRRRTPPRKSALKRVDNDHA